LAKSQLKQYLKNCYSGFSDFIVLMIKTASCS